jgi:hypothetical protein
MLFITLPPSKNEPPSARIIIIITMVGDETRGGGLGREK